MNKPVNSLTHPCWYPRFGNHQTFDGWAIDWTTFFVNELVSSFHVASTVLRVDTNLLLVAIHVALAAHLRDFALLDEAARARTSS